MRASVYANRGIIPRTIYLLVALVVWVFSGFGRRYRRQTVVLCYHGVTALQKRRFHWQMRHIARRAVDLAESEHSQTGHGALPRVCITFDDAFACLLENALPLMRELKIPATVFAVADNLGRRPKWPMAPEHPERAEITMTAEQLLRVANDGRCRIGSHTLTHADLAQLTPQRTEEELIQSKIALESLLGNKIEDLALPHGSYNDRILAAAQAADYRRIYTLDCHLQSPERDEPVVGRFLMSPDVWRIEYILTCAGAYSWLHAWRCILRRPRRMLQLPIHNQNVAECREVSPSPRI